MFEYKNPSLRGEVYSNMNSGVLELKVHEVHFAVKFSRAELARRTMASHENCAKKQDCKYQVSHEQCLLILTLPLNITESHAL